MTVLDPERTAATRSIGPARLLAGLDRADRVGLPLHGELHGQPPEVTRSALTDLAAAVGLRGRGGAAFPLATKLASMPAGSGGVVVVNGSESEPASHKDRVLLRSVPHLVLDGAVLVAGALGVRTTLVAVHDEAAAASLEAAVAERRDRVTIVRTGSGFVAGEARALLRGVSGGPALPPGRRVLPSDHGYDGRPTFLSNAETFAQLAILARYGAREFASTGLAAEPGTQLLTVGGAVAAPGVVETPTGIPLETVLAAAGAEPGPVLVGGYHGRWLADPSGVSLSRLPGGAAPASAGVVLALGRRTCPLGETQRVARWLAAQSAGQCGPCVFGLPALAADLDRLLAGDPSGWHDAHRHAGLVDGRGACAHPDGAARFVGSALTTFGDDVKAHLSGGGCGRPVLGVLPLPEGIR